MTDNNVARCKKCYGVALEPDGYNHILWHQSEDKKERAFRQRLLDAEQTIAQFAERINAAERAVAVFEADNQQMRRELDEAENADMTAPLVVTDLDIPEPEYDPDEENGLPTGTTEAYAAAVDAIVQPTEPEYPLAIDRPDEPVQDAISNLYTPRNLI